MHIIGLDKDNLEQIIYRGEGNSSIVIALRAQAKVIRLLKNDEPNQRSSQEHRVAHNPSGILKFIHLIMRPLADPFLSGSVELLHLKADFVDKLSKHIDVQRPLHRLDKTLPLDNQYALIMDDLCTLPCWLTKYLKPGDLCGPTISIEIKPKQGFLPVHRVVMRSSTNDQPGYKLRDSCLYSSYQYLKLHNGRIERKSDYCPIDLFSGCPVRMKIALGELMRNPQNNFRIFKNRALAYDDSNRCKFSTIFENFFEQDKNLNNSNGHRLGCKQQITTSIEDRLFDLLIQCLLRDKENKKFNLIKSSRPEDENFCHSSDICLQHPIRVRCRRCDSYPSSKKHKSDPSSQYHSLPQMCVLSCVLRAQKLDNIGAFEALFMLEWLLDHSKSNPTLNVIEELSKPQIPVGFGSLHQLPFESQHEYYFRKVWEFLVSLTAKDCSIMVTLRRITTDRYESIVREQPNVINHLLKDQRSGGYYLFNVGIADLDQKLPPKIPKICDTLNSLLHATDSLSKRFCPKALNKT